MLQTQGSRKGIQYPARPLRGEWWEPQDPWAVLQARCSQKGVQYFGETAAGEWWGPQDPWAVLQARDIGPCAQGGGQRQLLPRQLQPRPSGSKKGGGRRRRHLSC